MFKKIKGLGQGCLVVNHFFFLPPKDIKSSLDFKKKIKIRYWRESLGRAQRSASPLAEPMGYRDNRTLR